MSDGIVMVKVVMPFLSASLTVNGVCPLAPNVLLCRSMSQTNGPVPVSLTWLMVIFKVLPLVTVVTCLAVRAVSVVAPISILPPSTVRPHSLTTLAVISASEMKFASAGFVRSTIFELEMCRDDKDGLE